MLISHRVDVPVIFITKNDEEIKKKTNQYLESTGEFPAGRDRKIDKLTILFEEENAIVPNKPDGVEVMKTFLYKDMTIHLEWNISRIEATSMAITGMSHLELNTRIMIDFFGF